MTIFLYTAFVVLVFGVAVYLSVRSSLLRELDSSLESVARALSQSVDAEPGEVEVDIDSEAVALISSKEKELFFEMWVSGGTSLIRSPSVSEGGLRCFTKLNTAARFRFLKLGGNLKVRAVGFKFTPTYRVIELTGSRSNGVSLEGARTATRNAEPVMIVVARDFSPIARRLQRVLITLLVGGILTLCASVFGAFMTARYIARPLDRISEEVRARTVENLAPIEPTEPVPEEIEPLVATVNQLLGEVRETLQREKRFSSDVAHELKTRLAGLRTLIEVTITSQRGAGEYRRALTECVIIARRMEKIVDRLLCLARIEAGNISLEKRTIQLDELLQACWKPLEPLARQRSLSVEWSVAEGIALTTDPFWLAWRSAISSKTQSLIVMRGALHPSARSVRMALSL